MLARHMKCCWGCLGASLRGRSDEMIKDGRRRINDLGVGQDFGCSSLGLRRSAFAAAVAGEELQERFSLMSATRFRLNRFHLFGLIVMGCLLLALGLPGATPTRAAGNGEDYATNELGNPWDMDGPGDIAYEQTRDGDHLSNMAFA